MSGVTNTDLRNQLALTDQKITNLIDTLPANYVQIRSNDILIKSHEDKLASIQNRVKELEEFKDKAIAQSVEEHKAMRENWSGEVKALTKSMSALENSVTGISRDLSGLIRILMWALGIVSSIIVALVIAYLTHAIH